MEDDLHQDAIDANAHDEDPSCVAGSVTKHTIDLDYDDSANPRTQDLPSARLSILTFGLSTAIFVVALDNTIIATAIPKITTVFHSTQDVGWYASSYLLTSTTLQPLFGKLYTHFNVKFIYLFALVTFEVGSVICAAATSSYMLITGRAIAGAGAAALFSGALTIIAYSVALQKRALYIAILSSMFGLSSVVGPLLGGALTDWASWRWCFWINIPFGAVAFLTVLFFFANPRRQNTEVSFWVKLRDIDVMGACVFIATTVCLLLALQFGGSTYSWSNPKVWGCFLGFGLMLGILIWIQFKLGDRATLPPRILRNRTVAAAVVFSALLTMGVYTLVYYLPIYFQGVKETTAEGSGIRTIPFLISTTVASIIVGSSVTRLRAFNPLLWIGAAMFSIGSGFLYTLDVDSSPDTWIGYQLIAGFGAGACIQLPIIAVQVALDDKDVPIGNALAIFFNTLGGTIGVSIAQSIFTNSLSHQITIDAPSLDLNELLKAGVGDVAKIVSKDKLHIVIDAYNRAVTTVFILPTAAAGLAFLSSFLMEWKSVKGKNTISDGE